MEEKSLATEILQDTMRQNKRMFVLSIIIIALLFCYIGYDRYKDSKNSSPISVDQDTYEGDNDNNINK